MLVTVIIFVGLDLSALYYDLQCTQITFLLSGFTYPSISDQDKWLHKADYQLAKLTQGATLCVHIKVVVLAASYQSKRGISPIL